MAMTNRYDGHCVACGGPVAAGTGIVERGADRRWVTRHGGCKGAAALGYVVTCVKDGHTDHTRYYAMGCGDGHWWANTIADATRYTREEAEALAARLQRKEASRRRDPLKAASVTEYDLPPEHIAKLRAMMYEYGVCAA